MRAHWLAALLGLAAASGPSCALSTLAGAPIPCRSTASCPPGDVCAGDVCTPRDGGAAEGEGEEPATLCDAAIVESFDDAELEPPIVAFEPTQASFTFDGTWNVVVGQGGHASLQAYVDDTEAARITIADVEIGKFATSAMEARFTVFGLRGETAQSTGFIIRNGRLETRFDVDTESAPTDVGPYSPRTPIALRVTSIPGEAGAEVLLESSEDGVHFTARRAVEIVGGVQAFAVGVDLPFDAVTSDDASIGSVTLELGPACQF